MSGDLPLNHNQPSTVSHTRCGLGLCWLGTGGFALFLLLSRLTDYAPQLGRQSYICPPLLVSWIVVPLSNTGRSQREIEEV